MNNTRWSRWDVLEQTPVDTSVLTTDDWHLVTDTEGKAGSFHVRIGRNASGHLIITGLVMADAAPRITRDVLREIKPSGIIETFRWWELNEQSPDLSALARPLSSEPPEGFPQGASDDIPWWIGTGETIERVARSTANAPARGRPGPAAHDLDLFLQSYLVHHNKAQWVRPTQAEMKRRGYKGAPPTRATLNRWLKRLQNDGALPERTRTDG
ncbi:hypothetical protein HQQ80_09350 [Microbacteriaceae bacterium VKM Ac-2855]|nr:hypothetical protein [Microbacteriaceae bacterium VKM Ac-2855]